MGVVAAMHVALVFAIAGGLGLVPMPKDPVTVTTFIDEPHNVDPIPPLPNPIAPPRNDTVYVPMPEPVPFQDDTQTETITAQQLPAGDLPQSSGSADPQPQIVGAHQDARFPLSQPPYSPRDIREGNQGSVDVEVYVLPNGRVGDARIVKSAGFERLDQATIEEAKRSWRLVPATRDGVAIAQWYRLRVVFKLKTQ
jgi:protein TonB